MNIVFSTFLTFSVCTNRTNSFGVLEELVQCGICTEKLNQPRMLPCQHTFCLSCLKTQILAKTIIKKHPAASKGDAWVQCPQCHQKHSMAKGLESVENLPRNLYIDSLLKLLENHSPTDEKPSEIRCIKCQIVCNEHRLICQHCLQVGILYLCTCSGYCVIFLMNVLQDIYKNMR